MGIIVVVDVHWTICNGKDSIAIRCIKIKDSPAVPSLAPSDIIVFITLWKFSNSEELSDTLLSLKLI